MATRAKPTTEPSIQDQATADQNAADLANGTASVQIIGGHLTDEQHKMLYERMQRGLARRLYEVWVTAGQLSGPKWEWANQSTRSQQAWVAVARGVMGPALQEQFGMTEIASLIHG